MSPAASRAVASWQVSVMDKIKRQGKYAPQLWRMPVGKPERPRCARNVSEFSYDKGHSFCGYRAAVQIRGVARVCYFSARVLGWDGAFEAAVAQAKQWRALR